MTTGPYTVLRVMRCDALADPARHTSDRRLVWLCPRRYPDPLTVAEIGALLGDPSADHVLHIDPLAPWPPAPQAPAHLARKAWIRELIAAAHHHTERCTAAPAAHPFIDPDTTDRAVSELVEAIAMAHWRTT